MSELDFHKFPEPRSDFAGRSTPTSTQDLEDIAKLWRPSKAKLSETLSATVSRYSRRLVLADGTALTPEEIFEQAGTGTTESILAQLQGAEADPDRIGTEYLPPTLNPSVLVIPDFGASFGPTGAIGTRGGVLALGNGVDTDDAVAPRRVAGSYFGDLTGLNKLAARIAIVGIPLTATETVAGTDIQISGTLKLLFPPEFYVAEEPILGIKIGLALDGHETDAATNWLNYESLPAGAGEFIPILTNHLSLRVQFSNNAPEGVDQLIHDSANSAIVSDRVGSTDGISYPFISSGLTNLITAPVAAGNSITEETASPLWISVEIVTGASGTHGTTPFSAVYDLDTKVTLP